MFISGKCLLFPWKKNAVGSEKATGVKLGRSLIRMKRNHQRLFLSLLGPQLADKLQLLCGSLNCSSTAKMFVI